MSVLVCFQVLTYAPTASIQCQICHMVFGDQSAINAHYDTAHAQKTEHRDPKFECEVCGRKFTLQTNLKRHLRSTHSAGGADTFQCDVCSRVFKRKDYLKDHMKRMHKQ